MLLWVLMNRRWPSVGKWREWECENERGKCSLQLFSSQTQFLILIHSSVCSFVRLHIPTFTLFSRLFTHSYISFSLSSVLWENEPQLAAFVVSLFTKMVTITIGVKDLQARLEEAARKATASQIVPPKHKHERSIPLLRSRFLFSTRIWIRLTFFQYC
jgi:hypothetical protein